MCWFVCLNFNIAPGWLGMYGMECVAWNVWLRIIGIRECGFRNLTLSSGIEVRKNENAFCNNFSTFCESFEFSILRLENIFVLFLEHF